MVNQLNLGVAFRMSILTRGLALCVRVMRQI